MEVAGETIGAKESSRRGGKKRKTEAPSKSAPAAEESAGEGGSSRRTRSQAAPDWTTKEAMILVNEIAAIEGDWLKAFSSYQKWKIVVENCNAMDVRRNLFQCRGKWRSLLSDYNRIKQWGCKVRQGSDAYWSLDCEMRRQVPLPENFDHEVFIAIDEYVRSQADELDSDPDTDPEAEAELLEVIARLGCKRKKRYISVLEEEGEPWRGPAEGLSQGVDYEEKPQLYYPEEGEAEDRPELDYPVSKEDQKPVRCWIGEQVRCWIDEKDVLKAVKVEEVYDVEEDKNEPAVEEEEEEEEAHHDVAEAVQVEEAHDVEAEKNEEARVGDKNEPAVEVEEEEEEAHHDVVKAVQVEEVHDVEAEKNEEARVEDKNEPAVEEEEAHHESPAQLEEDVQAKQKNGDAAVVVEEEAHHNSPLAEKEQGIRRNEKNEAKAVQEEAHHESRQAQEEGNLIKETNDAVLVQEQTHHQSPVEQQQQEAEQGSQKTRERVGSGEQQMFIEEEKGDSYDDSESMPSCEVEAEADKNSNEKSKAALGEQRPYKRGRKPKALVEEEKMVEQVIENARLMIAITETKYPTPPPPPPPQPGSVDARHNDAALEQAKTEFVRRQADQLIACLGKILSILDRYPYLVQKYS